MVINMTKYENGIHVCETAAKEVGRKRLGDLGWQEQAGLATTCHHKHFQPQEWRRERERERERETET
jgi:hypothetical protein